MDKIRVGLYIRVSTQEQASEGYSIGEQADRLTKYADAHNWIVYKVYSDPGFSGAKMERPALKEMIRDVTHKRVDKILVYKLDRLSRSQKDTLYLIEDVLNANDVDFVSMTENLDTGTPFGRAMIGILSVFAQLEREQIRERMQLGLDARAKDGYYHGGPYAPIGYDYVDGELIINEYEALQVRKIFELASNGLPLYSIYKTIRDAGYTTKYGQWHDSGIRSVLSSIVYTGRISWKGEIYPGRHEAIISVDEWTKLQDQVANRDTKHYRRVDVFKRTSLLGGLIFCGNCGARYYVKQNTLKKTKTPRDPDAKPNKYYTCYSRGKSKMSLVRDPNCKNKSYNVKDLDKAILDEIRKLALDPAYLDEVIEDQKPENDHNDRAVLESRLGQIESEIRKLVDLYQIGGLDFNIINDKIATLTEERATLEYELDILSTDESKPVDIVETTKALSTFAEIVDDPKTTTEDLRAIIEQLIDSIIIEDDVVKINWKFTV